MKRAANSPKRIALTVSNWLDRIINEPVLRRPKLRRNGSEANSTAPHTPQFPRPIRSEPMEEVAPVLLFQSLFASGLAAVRKYQCRAFKGGPTDEEQTSSNDVVFLQRGAFCKHTSRRCQQVIDVNQVGFFASGSIHRVSQSHHRRIHSFEISVKRIDLESARHFFAIQLGH